jgi:UDP-glucose 4-epimerase
MKVIVTGGAGFIGSHLVDKLVELGEEVFVIDNFSSGSLENITHNIGKKNFNFAKADLKRPEEWMPSFKDTKVVFHFAANPDVKSSIMKPDLHFNENVLATFNVLEAMRKYDIEYLIFSSSSTVYGEAKTLPTPENYSPLEPISIYGSFKLVCENLVKVYGDLYGFRYLILRYANIVGGRFNRGVIYDFIRKLQKNKTVLEILGDGTQKKSYMYIDDAVNASIHLYNLLVNNMLKHTIFNIGSEDWITVLDIAKIVLKQLKIPDIVFHLNPQTDDGRGWIGDVKLMLLDISLLKSTGFTPKYNSKEAVTLAVKDLIKSERIKSIK